MLSLGVAALGAAAGCNSEDICHVGCAGGGRTTARFASGGPGSYSVTYCVGQTCEDATGEFPERPGTAPWRIGLEAEEATDELLLTIYFAGPSAPADGDVIVLSVRGPDGAVLKQGVAVVKYRTYDNGCTRCSSFRASID
ncbi:MAG: hypothetical protein FJ104_08590 [Deltaproteobacteria bacterium]|nr:hypothetical protein [Deltaproteobacteria bacterium]